MTNEETIEYLKNSIGKGLQEHKEAVEIAVAAIEKQIKKPVILSGDDYAYGELVYVMAECPNCGETYYEGESGWVEPFCPKCGQALDWSCENDE